MKKNQQNDRIILDIYENEDETDDWEIEDRRDILDLDEDDDEVEDEDDVDYGEVFQGCALTEDECDALGIDFNQHNLDLRD